VATSESADTEQGSIPGRTPQKIARPQDSHVVMWPAGDQEKHD